MARRPSNEWNSPALNLTELQRGQAWRNHNTRGSQFGQVVDAVFI